MKIEKEIYETFFILQSMHSLHWRRSVMKMWAQLNRQKVIIARIIVLLKRLLLEIEEGHCMGNMTKTLWHKKITEQPIVLDL